MNIAADGASVQKLIIYSHTGTHIDTAAHVLEGGRHITDFNISELIFDRVGLIELALPDGTLITPELLYPYENILMTSDFVIFNFGLSDRRKCNPQLYINGSPGFTVEAGRYLVSHRRLRGIGMDSPSAASIMHLGKTMAVHNELLTGYNGSFIIIEEMKLEERMTAPSKMTVTPWQVIGMHSGPCIITGDYPSVTTADTEYKIRCDILKGCRWITDKELVYSTWGNISVRFGDGLLLTPSKMDYNIMTPDDMIYMDFDGKIISGSRVPTSEREIHRLIMKRRSDINAVVHTHSPYACAAAAAGINLPALIEEIPQLIGGMIPCTLRYIEGGRHLELAEHVAETIGDSVNAVLIRNHGPVVCGRTLDEALYACLVVEKAAQITLILKGGTAFTPIPDNSVSEERNRFLYKYGKE